MGLGAVFITRPGETDPAATRSSNAMSVVVSSAIDLLAKFLLLAIWARHRTGMQSRKRGIPRFSL